MTVGAINAVHQPAPTFHLPGQLVLARFEVIEQVEFKMINKGRINFSINSISIIIVGILASRRA